MNKAAQKLGRMARGVPKTMTPAAMQQRRDALAARWSSVKRKGKNK